MPSPFAICIFAIVLLGTPKHPEVVGLLGFAPDAIVVDEEEDWVRIPSRKRMAWSRWTMTRCVFAARPAS